MRFRVRVLEVEFEDGGGSNMIPVTVLRLAVTVFSVVVAVVTAGLDAFNLSAYHQRFRV